MNPALRNRPLAPRPESCATDDLVARVLDRRSPFGRFVAPIVVGLLLGSCLANVQALIRSFQTPAIYGQKDIIQEWLMARAILSGIDPYQTTSELARHFLGEVGRIQNGAHPTPHPPTAGLMFLPLALVSYKTSVFAWLGIELGFLVMSLYFIGRTCGLSRPVLATLCLFPVALAWGAVSDDLMLGQLVITQLGLLSLAWYLIRRNHSSGAAVAVGLAILLKPMIWPVALYFPVRGEKRASAVLLATGVGGFTSALLAVGRSELTRYIFDVLPLVDRMYAASLWNLSVATLGPRLFGGTSSPVQNAVSAPPLFPIPSLVEPVALTLPFVLLLGTIWLGRGLHPLGYFSALVGVSVVVSPVAWGPYLALLSIPCAWIGVHILIGRGTWRVNRLAIGAMLVLVPRWDVWVALAERVGGQVATLEEQIEIPAAAGLITMVPTIAAIILVVVILRSQFGDAAYGR